MNDITFTDRDSWIAFRADWRARYKEASEAVRAEKREIARLRRLRREMGEAGDHHRHEADGRQWDLHRARRCASGLMAELDDAKERKAKAMAALVETAKAA